MNPRIALGAAVVCALLAADDAFAKDGKAPKRQTMEMTRSSGADADATGTVKVTHGKRRDTTVLTLNHLDPRSRYEVRESGTGELLGHVRTNRKGHGTFNLSKSLAKAASSGGSEGDVDEVDVVDPDTGEVVLTGDVTPPDPVPAYGFESYADDDGDSAYVEMSTYPDYGDTFSLSFYPAADASADPAGSRGFAYAFLRDTASGDDLPLGASSVTELAGRAFEIRGADGAVALAGDLPALQDAEDPIVWDEPPVWDDGGDDRGGWDDGNGWDYTIGWDAWGGVDDDGVLGNGGSDDPSNGVFDRKSAKSHRHHGKADEADYRLFVADANGDFQDCGALEEQTYDDGGGCGYDDPYFWVIVIIIAPDEGFDLDEFLRGILGGGAFAPTTGDDGSGSDEFRWY
jgi:hypothetical protein